MILKLKWLSNWIWFLFWYLFWNWFLISILILIFVLKLIFDFTIYLHFGFDCEIEIDYKTDFDFDFKINFDFKIDFDFDFDFEMFWNCWFLECRFSINNPLVKINKKCNGPVFGIKFYCVLNFFCTFSWRKKHRKQRGGALITFVCHVKM